MAFQDIVSQISGLPAVVVVLKNQFALAATIYHMITRAGYRRPDFRAMLHKWSWAGKLSIHLCDYVGLTRGKRI
jgi:hypothetical protein